MAFKYHRLFLVGPVALASPAWAHSTSNFEDFFPAWESMLKGIMANNCTEQFANYHNKPLDDHWAAFDLTDCILSNMTEFQKIEMSITAVILGLLPAMLRFIGPAVAEVSLLAVRRPILALLLAIACPTVRIGGHELYVRPHEGLKQPVVLSAKPWLLSQQSYRTWMMVMISGFEYLIAMSAAGNVIYQAYRLSYRSISVSAIAIQAESLSPTYPPFLWTFLIIAVHLFSFWEFNLRLRTERPTNNTDATLEPLSLWRSSLWRLVRTELTPCMYGTPLRFEEVPGTYLHAYVNGHVKLGVAAVFIYGTVALSSQLFISLGDAVPIIAWYFLGTLVCHLILRYELHGMRETTSGALETVRNSNEDNSRLAGDI